MQHFHFIVNDDQLKDFELIHLLWLDSLKSEANGTSETIVWIGSKNYIWYIHIPNPSSKWTAKFQKKQHAQLWFDIQIFAIIDNELYLQLISGNWDSRIFLYPK